MTNYGQLHEKCGPHTDRGDVMLQVYSLANVSSEDTHVATPVIFHARTTVVASFTVYIFPTFLASYQVAIF